MEPISTWLWKQISTVARIRGLNNIWGACVLFQLTFLLGITIGYPGLNQPCITRKTIWSLYVTPFPGLLNLICQQFVQDVFTNIHEFGPQFPIFVLSVSCFGINASVCLLLLPLLWMRTSIVVSLPHFPLLYFSDGKEGNSNNLSLSRNTLPEYENPYI